MNDGFQETHKSLGELRRGEGLTARVLAKHPHVLERLDTTDPYEGVERLFQLARKVDGRAGQVLRAALAVGVERLANTKARREAIEKQLVISDSVRWRDEREALTELTRLVLEYKDGPLPTAEDVFQQAGPVVLDDPDLDAPAEADELDDQPASPAQPKNTGFIQVARGAVGRWSLPTDREQVGRLALVATGGVGLVVALTLLLTGVIPLGSNAHPAADKIESATVPSGVTVRGLAAPKLDNSRGWGPERKKTYTWEHPASFPVFNSITNNPYHGDERNFLQCKDTEKNGQSWADELVAKDGHTYECYLYIGNDVAPNLDTNVAARLQNARVHLSLPDERTLNPGITGILSADNAPQIWDSCNFVAARPVTLIYESGSARLHTNGTPQDGSPLPGETDGLIQDTGALLGDKGDGIVGQNAGYLTFQMTAVLG